MVTPLPTIALVGTGVAAVAAVAVFPSVFPLALVAFVASAVWFTVSVLVNNARYRRENHIPYPDE